MFHREIMIILGCVCLASPAAVEKAGPWQSVWTMTLQEKERVYVDYGGSSFLVVTVEDLRDLEFMNRKDVALDAKFARVDDGRPVFYGLSDLGVLGGGDTWATAVEGDNFHLLGHFTKDAKGALQMQLRSAVPAQSDAEAIAVKLNAVPDTDAPGRLAIAEWVREMAERQGNREFWLESAAAIARTTIREAAARAGKAQDGALLLKAMDWALDRLGDQRLAAEIGSAEWLLKRDDATAKTIGERMHALGFRYHQIEGDPVRGWLPQAESLTREFEQRFQNTDWRDAEAYYQLGRWADTHADMLPGAATLSHRAYTAGHRADPTHNGINRELGLELVAVSAHKADANLFRREAKGLLIRGPDRWLMSARPVKNIIDVSWIDPGSDTAWVGARILEGGLDAAWQPMLSQLRVYPEFQAAEPTKSEHPLGPARAIGFQFKEGNYVRQGMLQVIECTQRSMGICLLAGFVEEERSAVTAAFRQLAERTTVGQAAAEAVKPAAEGPGPATGAPGPATPPTDGGKPEPKPSPAPAQEEPGAKGRILVEGAPALDTSEGTPGRSVESVEQP